MSTPYWSDGAAGPVLSAEREPDWREQSSCTLANTDLFFGYDGEVDAERVAREDRAKAVCASCPVRAECLAFAMGSERGANWRTRAGIFGGRNGTERFDLERGQVTRRRGRPPAGPKPSLPELTEADLARFRARMRPGPCGTEWGGIFREDKQKGVWRPCKGGPEVSPPRLAYKLATGVDPGADEVQQKCGNRRCLTTECLIAVPRHLPGRPDSRAA